VVEQVISLFITAWQKQSDAEIELKCKRSLLQTRKNCPSENNGQLQGNFDMYSSVVA